MHEIHKLEPALLSEQEMRLIALMRRMAQSELKIIVSKGVPVMAQVIERDIEL